MGPRNYHQARRQKEQSRKARQQLKQERRLGRAAVPEGEGTTPTEVSPDAVQRADPPGTVSSS